MSPDQFVANVKAAVHDGAIRTVLESLQRPSGRKPPQRLVDLSRWYHSLAADDRARLEQVIGLAVHSGVFGFFAVLDGVKSIANKFGNLKLELQAVDGGQRTVLNPESGEMLHDLYQGHVYAEVFGGPAA